MRIRNVLAGAALGSALVLGGLAAPAQAAPAPVNSNTTAAAPTTSAIVVVGWYSTKARCEADGENSVYSWWDCRWSSNRRAWGLYVDTNS
ncbi:hypothetical protein AB8O64_35420 (plasmid) [Streptomyces sp. QH1-20]|uniref:hypothetical protein n=1 Tax=Streptomyces sp. QH1-20 TaxID=3240934 RepID=UPI00351192E7